MLKQFAFASIALAAAAAASAQTTASTTSAVTVYGVADAYVQSVSGADRVNRVQSGGLAGSRFGVRGSEDLGDGFRGIFTLESGINLDDGSYGQNAFWGRQSFVGLATPYGQVTLGRQYASIYALSGDFSVFSNTGVAASTAVIGGFGGYEPVRGSATSATGNGGPARVNNSVKYETPNFNGLRGGALVGLGEVTGGTNQNRVADIYARYTAGPLDAMVSYVDDKADATGLGVRTASAAAAYTFGPARVTGGVISVNDRGVNNADGTGVWIGSDYRIGNHLLKAQFVENKAKNFNEGTTKAFGVGYQYDLSKRTAFYSSLTRFNNDGTAYADRWASTVPAGLTNSGDRNITEVVAGVRHSF